MMSSGVRSNLLNLLLIAGVSGLFASPVVQADMRGMMGSGMMGGQGSGDQSSPAKVNPERAKALTAYIQDQHLQCMQCHGVSGGGMGPSFVAIAAGNAHKKDAQEVLARHIAHGIRSMPPGLASESQSVQLAKMILMLNE